METGTVPVMIVDLIAGLIAAFFLGMCVGSRPGHKERQGEHES